MLSTRLFGPEYASMPGCVLVPEASIWRHRFGGTSWKVIDPEPSLDGPALLLVLDLSDPLLDAFGLSGFELPLCTYLNCDVWAHDQTYSVRYASKEVVMTRRVQVRVNELPPAHRLPNPLPERPVSLRPMTPKEYPVDEQAYWDTCDRFLGGSNFVRIGR